MRATWGAAALLLACFVEQRLPIEHQLRRHRQRIHRADRGARLLAVHGGLRGRRRRDTRHLVPDRQSARLLRDGRRPRRCVRRDLLHRQRTDRRPGPPSTAWKRAAPGRPDRPTPESPTTRGDIVEAHAEAGSDRPMPPAASGDGVPDRHGSPARGDVAEHVRGGRAGVRSASGEFRLAVAPRRRCGSADCHSIARRRPCPHLQRATLRRLGSRQRRLDADGSRRSPDQHAVVLSQERRRCRRHRRSPEDRVGDSGAPITGHWTPAAALPEPLGDLRTVQLADGRIVAAGRQRSNRARLCRRFGAAFLVAV